jgi:hypothetical protein
VSIGHDFKTPSPPRSAWASQSITHRDQIKAVRRRDLTARGAIARGKRLPVHKALISRNLIFLTAKKSVSDDRG